MFNDSLLKNKVALVTGASSGLGAHFSKVLAGAGATVIVAARRVDRLEALVASIEEQGGSAFAVAMDVQDEKSIRAGYEKIEAEVGVVDVLVNNAGASGDTKLLASVTLEDWDFVMGVNLRGAWIVAQEMCQRLIKTEKSGCIVNISSLYGLRESLAKVPYNVSKAAVAQLTKTMAAEMTHANHPIRINALCPGYFLTELNDDYFNAESGANYIKRTPAGRLGQLEELDGPLLLLASDASSFINGALLPVDGGHAIKPI
ncbi:2-deoxy-D-gluconate 3-dehydrogenase [Oceanicoccus sagamiensis]|uniref:2-deoxy-D-gluconate 3-dehydrogenase n=2 Tax=Oceanicoccus sagamiensis TaxID=716816 RepID=A0A1X9NIR9_9GAMM|nr:2-deoxy-D-gluconate 3-dehydrogenase [Oceanicoccus sagamiensis]